MLTRQTLAGRALARDLSVVTGSREFVRRYVQHAAVEYVAVQEGYSVGERRRRMQREGRAGQREGEQRAHGRTYITPPVPRDKVDVLLAGSGRERGRLKPRQREILQLLAEGRFMKQVAREFGVTTRTVAFCRYCIMDQPAIDSSAGLVHLAIEEGLAVTSDR